MSIEPRDTTASFVVVKSDPLIGEARYHVQVVKDALSPLQALKNNRYLDSSSNRSTITSMPPKSRTPITTKKQDSKAQSVKRLSTGLSQHDEDSKEDLEDDDIPWQWIEADEKQIGDAAGNDAPPSRKSKVRSGVKKIIGAKKGRFECRIGDCLIMMPDRNEVWAGIACDFREDGDEEDQCVKIMWFQSEPDIKNGPKKRNDFLPNERYVSMHANYCPIESIGGKASIVSEEMYNEIFPPGQKNNKKLKTYATTFICRRGVEARSSRYTSEFVWEYTVANSSSLHGRAVGTAATCSFDRASWKGEEKTWSAASILVPRGVNSNGFLTVYLSRD